MFRLHSIKQHSESIAVLVFFFSRICLLFPGLLLNEPVSPVAATLPGSSFSREQQKAACRWFLPLPVVHTKQAASLASVKRPQCLLAPSFHWSSCTFLVYCCSSPLWPNWDFAHVLRKLNYCTAKVHLCPRSLTQMMKLSYSSFW